MSVIAEEYCFLAPCVGLFGGFVIGPICVIRSIAYDLLQRCDNPMDRIPVMGSTVFAHSLPGQPIENGELLAHHLARVGERAAEFATTFGWEQAGRVAGRLHDI